MFQQLPLHHFRQILRHHPLHLVVEVHLLVVEEEEVHLGFLLEEVHLGCLLVEEVRQDFPVVAALVLGF
jgi:hypothetical protein